MPSFPIKPRPDKDFYVLWSTVVDDVVGYGTRKEVEALILEDRISWIRHETERAFARADNTEHRLGREGLIVSNGPEGRAGLLSLDRLYDYAQLLIADEPARAASLVDPFPDESTNDA
jgi:hypothetical protein